MCQGFVLGTRNYSVKTNKLFVLTEFYIEVSQISLFWGH